MNIENYRVKPELICVTIDSESIKETYGETIDFWMYDHLDIKTYFDFFDAQSKGDTESLLKIVSGIILDSKARPVISEAFQLPVDIFTEAVLCIGKQLGKSRTKNSQSQVQAGTQ